MESSTKTGTKIRAIIRLNMVTKSDLKNWPFELTTER